MHFHIRGGLFTNGTRGFHRLRGPVLPMMAWFAFSLCIPEMNPSVRAGEVIQDMARGFQFAAPDKFERIETPSELNRPKILYAFADGDPTDAESDLIVLVEGMGITIGRERLKPAAQRLPRELQMFGIFGRERLIPPDFQGKVSSAQWKEFILETIEVPEVIQGQESLTIVVGIPLKREAIQLLVTGPADRETEIRSTLNTTLASFEGESNWLHSAAPAQTAENEHYWQILGAIAIVTVLLGVVVFWRYTRTHPRQNILYLGVLLYIASFVYDTGRVREMLLLTGAMRLLATCAVLVWFLRLFVRPKIVVSTDTENGVS